MAEQLILYLKNLKRDSWYTTDIIHNHFVYEIAVYKNRECTTRIGTLPFVYQYEDPLHPTNEQYIRFFNDSFTGSIYLCFQSSATFHPDDEGLRIWLDTSKTDHNIGWKTPDDVDITDFNKTWPYMGKVRFAQNKELNISTLGNSNGIAVTPEQVYTINFNGRFSRCWIPPQKDTQLTKYYHSISELNQAIQGQERDPQIGDLTLIQKDNNSEPEIYCYYGQQEWKSIQKIGPKGPKGDKNKLEIGYVKSGWPAAATITEDEEYNTQRLNLQLPQGEKGDKGDNNVLTIGSVQEGNTANVTISGNSPNQILNFTLPKGLKGDKGDKGEKGDVGQKGENNILRIGTVRKGLEPSVTIKGDSPNQVLNFVLPQGDQGLKGDKGDNNVLSIGKVQKGDIAKVSIEGESPNQILNFVLPKGDKGEQGKQGFYYTPNISNGLLSWTNNGSLPNPDTIQVIGPKVELVTKTTTAHAASAPTVDTYISQEDPTKNVLQFNLPRVWQYNLIKGIVTQGTVAEFNLSEVERVDSDHLQQKLDMTIPVGYTPVMSVDNVTGNLYVEYKKITSELEELYPDYEPHVRYNQGQCFAYNNLVYRTINNIPAETNTSFEAIQDLIELKPI